MRANSAVYRLSFILPDRLYRIARPGVVAPCLHGSLLTVHGAGLVSCEGLPLDQVLEQARRFLTGLARGEGLLSIGATLLDLGRPDAPQRYLISGGGRTITIAPRAQLALPGFADVA